MKKPATLYAIQAFTTFYILLGIALVGWFMLMTEHESFTPGLGDFMFGFIEAMGYDPATYGAREAGELTGGLVLLLPLQLLVLASVSRRWGRWLIASSCLWAVFAWANGVCAAVIPVICLLCAVSRSSQDYLKEGEQGPTPNT